MAYSDFQQFLQALEDQKELVRVSDPVSPYLEIGALADRAMLEDGPALLFEKVVGPNHRYGTPDPMSAVMGQASIHPNAVPSGSRDYGLPVAINTMGSRKRMSMALSCSDFEEHAQRIEALMKPELPKGPVEGLKKLISVLGELKSAPPKTVSNPLCQQKVTLGDDIDLGKLPILTCWPEDGGPFVTLPMVFTHDPDTGKRNVGMYRIQAHGPKTCGMHWQMHKTGARHMEAAAARNKPIEVCVALGGDPALAFSAVAPLPPGIDEMLFAGFLRRENVRMAKAKTVDIMVPAEAEIVIEGYIDPHEKALEGPFGDHTGYYSLAEDFPLMHVTAITSRDNPVYPATIVGRPPKEDGWMGKAVERIFLPMIKMTVPEIVDMNLPVAACFHNMAFVSIKKKYVGHAFKVMNAIWGLGGMAFTKMVYVFDEDCDVQNLDEVLFRIGANCDPARDTLHSRGPVDQLDHASLAEGFGGKLGFDCTHKWPGENGFSRDYPKLIQPAKDVEDRIEPIWQKIRKATSF